MKMEKAIKMSSMFIGSSVAQYEQFMRKQVHICFHQLKLQSTTRLLRTLIQRLFFSIFLIRN